MNNILIPYTEDERGITYSGSPSYLDVTEQIKINSCLTQKIERLGFDTKNPIKLNGYALLKRRVLF